MRKVLAFVLMVALVALWAWLVQQGNTELGKLVIGALAFAAFARIVMLTQDRAALSRRCEQCEEDIRAMQAGSKGANDAEPE